MRNVRIVLGTELSCFYPAVGVFIVEKEMQVFLLQIALTAPKRIGARLVRGVSRQPSLPLCERIEIQDFQK